MTVRTPPAAKTTSILNTPEARKIVSQAPDYKAVGVMKGNKRQITLTIPPPLLTKVDEHATENGISRASWIVMTLAKAVKND